MSEIEVIEGGHLTTPQGFLAGAVSAGLYASGPKAGGLDLCLLVSERPCAVAAVFTQNEVKGAPVLVSQERMRTGRIRGVVANSGCSNSLNGEGGFGDAVEMTQLAGQHAGLDADEVSVSSTGVTGVRMPMDKVRAAIPRIELTRDGGPGFARAIMTTDTRPKEFAVRVTTPAGSYAIGGCAKGVGMIHPNMATMLCYVTTDAAVEPGFMRTLQREVADETLNIISVDGDTSCSDTFLLLANGAAGLPPITADRPESSTFRAALLQVATHLAKELARDGEGAARLIEVEVTGAATLSIARQLARTITTSPLVKTAVAGCDPNWGRIMVAAGRAGVPVVEAQTSVWLQGEPVFDRGRVVPFDEKALSARLDAPDVYIHLDLGAGDASAKAWGCDLTVDYVHINADYRT